jgi:TrmH family RNA methyltransferase
MRGGPKLIQSRDNPRVKALLKLAGSSRERRSTGTTLLEGERLVRAYCDSGGIAETIFAAESALAKSGLRALFESAPARARFALADRLVEQISQLVSAAGVAAVVRTPEPGPPPQALSTCVLLENIQDPGNLGSILRSAVAAGIPHIFLSHSSVFAWSPKVIRAAMGAHFFISIFEKVDLVEVVRVFGGRVVAMEPRAGSSLYDLDLKGPVAWVFGNEGAGLSDSIGHIATDRVCVPMPGCAESLNVAAAVAVCLFEQVRQKALSTPASQA